MKKVLLCCFILLLVGCGNKKVENTDVQDDIPKPIKVVRESDESVASCFLDDSKFSIVFKNGQIIRYYDPYDGELNQEALDNINNEHLVGVTDDNKAISIMSSVIKELGGYCEKEE